MLNFLDYYHFDSDFRTDELYRAIHEIKEGLSTWSGRLPAELFLNLGNLLFSIICPAIFIFQLNRIKTTIIFLLKSQKPIYL